MTEQTMVNGEWIEQWHLKPLRVKEDDRVRFTFKPPGGDELREKTGTVTYIPDEDSRLSDTYATVDIDDAGKWVLDRGSVSIKQEGRSNRWNGTLINVEKIPREGMKIVTESGVVAEVLEVNEDRDSVHVQRCFNPTSLHYNFDEIDREVR